MMMPSRPIATIVLAPLVALAVVACGMGGDSRIPITTSSPEALDLYLQGRQLRDRLRYTDARDYFDRAVAKDTDFALAHLGAAMTSAISNEFFASLGRAVELSDKVTDGERHMILAYLAGVSGDPLQQDEHLTWLVDNYPGDERAMNLRGNYHFGRQEFDDAVAYYEKATAINPEFSQPYNQLGYVYRFQGRFAQAEEAFRKYIDLIPDEPNPFDSYAEMLMKLGRFEESIETYKKALALDRHFMASYIGIGHNFLLLDRPDDARSWFRRMSEVARTSLERRQAHMWSAAAFLHEGRDREALKEVEAMYAIAEKDGNVTAMSTDLTRMGHILLEAGAPEGALARFRDSLAIVQEAEVPSGRPRRGSGEVPRLAGDRPGGRGSAAGQGVSRTRDALLRGPRRAFPGTDRDRRAQNAHVRGARRGPPDSGRDPAAARVERADRAASRELPVGAGGVRAGQPAGSARSLPDRARLPRTGRSLPGARLRPAGGKVQRH
jgi:tetratricopeptide (TPR) repeat protein